MRRIYIAIALILISVGIGIFTSGDLKRRGTRHLFNIDKVERYIENREYEKAERLCKKTADEFRLNDSRIMYIYYVHKDLAEIGENLYSMHDFIKNKKDSDYYNISGITKSKLQTIIDKEPLNIQNIL